MIGTKLGRYEIVESLGSGGMGEVYLALDPALGRNLAIKVLPRELIADTERRARLVQEARAASSLNHPNIVTVHDLGEADGMVYIAMERIEGGTFRQWMQAEPRKPSSVLKVIRQAASALGAAHTAGLVHRDLKPENLMVRADGLLKILDFGLARSTQAEPATGPEAATVAGTPDTSPGMVLGTVPYMSPEQVLGKPPGPRSDLFALAVILYEALVGKHPFQAETNVDTLHRVLHETPEPPSRAAKNLSPQFDFVLAKGLAKDPERRHPTALDFDVDLEALQLECESSSSSVAMRSAGPRTVAVLPFKNIGGDPEIEYLGMGLADAVITRLAESPDLIVRTTSSILEYEGRIVDPRQVGQDLSVSSILDASFQKAGARFRATARLVDANSGQPQWAGKVDVGFEDVFEVQDQVAQGIAEALTARLSASESRKTYTPSPDAFERVMRARASFRLGTKGEFLSAVEVLEKVVEVEPEYVDAWANLGSTYHAIYDSGLDVSPEWQRKEAYALERAAALDPKNYMVRFGIGCMKLVQGEKREAYAELTGAMKLAPNYYGTYHFLGYLFRLCDMSEEAEACYLEAIRLDPHAPWSYSAMVRLLAIHGEFDKAEEWIARIGRQFGMVFAEAFRGPVFAYQGRYPEALEARDHFQALVKKQGETTSLGSLNAFNRVALLMGGRVEEGKAEFMEYLAHGDSDMDSAAEVAGFFGQVGDMDKAFQYLDRAVELGNDMLTDYENQPFFEPLRSDPRWEPFLAGVRSRVAGWKQEFRWPPE